MANQRGRSTYWRVKWMCALIVGLLAIAKTGVAQDREILGERGAYLAARFNVAGLTAESSVSDLIGNRLARTASYSEHPLHELASRIRPGVQLDAHSKALLRMEPAAHLVAFLQDSLYLARPGNALVHLIVDGKSRRTNIIPDSLFLVPEDRYIFGIQVTRDLLLGRIEAYAKRSSRVVGVFSMRIDGRAKILVVSSHDYLASSDVSLAIFTPGLIFEDLIRVQLGQLGVEDMLPTHFGPASLTWQNEFGQDVEFHLHRAEGREGVKGTKSMEGREGTESMEGGHSN